MKNTMAVLMLIASAAQASALSEDRAERLFDALESSLQCDAVSGYLRVRLADERQRLSEVWTTAGFELSQAMFTGEMPNSVSAKGRTCLTRFEFAENPEVDEVKAAFNIGFLLGHARSCFSQIFLQQLQQAVPLGQNVDISPQEEIEERERVQQYAFAQFEQRNCRFVRLPD
jgi:hypothetical protein